MKTIAVIDDDIYINDMLDTLLRQNGYETLRAWSGTEALYLLQAHRPDLVLLDLMLPGLSGEEVLPKLRGIPVIVLSARADVEDRIRLLLDGAADYLTKPFDTGELLARITVQLRKTEQTWEEGILSHGPLRLDTVSHMVTCGSETIRLTRTEYAILKLLLQNPGQVIARSVILDRIAGDTPDCTESSLKQHVSNLRRKLGEDVRIEAVWGIGFRLES